MSAFSTNEGPLSSSKLNQKTVLVAATAPGSPTNGQLWFDTTNNLLKQYRTVDSLWHNLGTGPLLSKLASPFVTTSITPVDTGLSIVSVGPSIVFVMLDITKSNTLGVSNYRLYTSAGTPTYCWLLTFTSGNYAFTTLNADCQGTATQQYMKLCLWGYVPVVATVKVQVWLASASESLTIATGSALVVEG